MTLTPCVRQSRYGLRRGGGLSSPWQTERSGMEDLRARDGSNIGEQDLKFAFTGIGICVIVALALMIFG
jgi:hypothetical protein